MTVLDVFNTILDVIKCLSKVRVAHAVWLTRLSPCSKIKLSKVRQLYSAGKHINLYL